MSVIHTIQARIVELETEMNSVKASIETDGRLMTAIEADGLEKAQSEHADLTRQAKLLNGVGSSVKAAAAPAGRPVRSVITSNEKAFKNLGEMAVAVKAKAQGVATDRMVNALSDYASEGTSQDGGAAVPGEFRTQIEKEIYGQSSLLGMVTNIPLSQNTVTFPVDNNTPWAPFSGTGKAAWKGEAAALDQVKPNLTTLQLTAHKLGVVLPVTDELLEDSTAFAAYINSTVGENLTYLINQAILSGSGVGEAKGILLSPAVKTVASGSGQGAGTVIAKNVMDLYFGMPQMNRGNGVWLINPNVEAQLYGMVISGTQTAAYVPAGSMAGGPYSTLLGRPVVVLPNAPALGTTGDVVFADLSKYWAVTKGGLNTQTSIHFYFDQVVSAFRFYIRMGGNTRRQSVITLPDSTTQAHFVKLAAR